MLPELHAIAFDLDGTLVDSMPDLAAAANAMREQMHMPRLPESTIQNFVGDGIAKLIHRSLCNHSDQLAPDELWQQGHQKFIVHYAKHLADFSQPYPQVEKTLTQLKQQHWPMAVITNKSESFAKTLLNKLNLDHFFKEIIGADTLPEKKPSALPLHHTAAQLGTKTSHMLMIGDSHNDILAARAAQSPAILITHGYGDTSALCNNPKTKPDMVIDRIDQLLDIIHAPQ